MRHLVLALLMAWAGAAWADDYDQALAELKHHSKGFGIPDTKEARAAQDALWHAAQQWTVAYLDAHPKATPVDLAQVSKGEDRPQLSAVVLDAKTLLIATQFGETGNVFIVAGTAKGFAVVWDIARATPPKKFPQLRAWSVEGAAGMCGRDYGQKDWQQCGPYYATLLRLPNDVSGLARFAIDASHAEEAGSTDPKQISLWRWNGQSPEFLLGDNYRNTLSDDVGTRIENGKLLVRDQRDFKTADVTAADPGRATDWTIDLDPKSVKDMGHKEVFPETALIDDVLTAKLKGRDDPHLTRKASKALDAVLNAREYIEPGIYRLGGLNGEVILHEHGVTKVCFNPDDLGPVWFTLIPKGKTFSIVDVVHSKYVDCRVSKEK